MKNLAPLCNLLLTIMLSVWTVLLWNPLPLAALLAERPVMPLPLRLLPTRPAKSGAVLKVPVMTNGLLLPVQVWPRWMWLLSLV